MKLVHFFKNVWNNICSQCNKGKIIYLPPLKKFTEAVAPTAPVKSEPMTIVHKTIIDLTDQSPPTNVLNRIPIIYYQMCGFQFAKFIMNITQYMIWKRWNKLKTFWEGMRHLRVKKEREFSTIRKTPSSKGRMGCPKALVRPENTFTCFYWLISEWILFVSLPGSLSTYIHI